MTLFVTALALLTAGGLACLALGRRPAAAGFGVISCLAACGAAAIASVDVMLSGQISDLLLSWQVPFGSLHLGLDGLSSFFALVTAVVCLANTEGGELYLGVEKDGAITGLHPEHQNLATLTALIANRTSPPVSVRVTALQEVGKTIARIEIPKSMRLVATAEGLLQRRRLQADGTPQCVPFHPHEFASRQSDLGVLTMRRCPWPKRPRLISIRWSVSA